MPKLLEICLEEVDVTIGRSDHLPVVAGFEVAPPVHQRDILAIERL